VTGGYTAAVLGISQKLRVSSSLVVDGQYELRTALSRLPETDPQRALPFSQQERDHWAVSLGTEWTPTRLPARAGIRAELHDGKSTGRGYRILGSAEADINDSWAVLVREDSRVENGVTSIGAGRTSSSQSILAAAFRPASRTDWNALLKLEVRSDENSAGTPGLSLQGTNERIIGAVETAWTPDDRTEIGARYAIRNANLGGLLASGGAVAANTQYIGARAKQQITSRFDLRIAARALTESHSELQQWDLASAVGIRLIQGLDLETGYRFGELHDADFARSGGHGFYATLGLSLTEQTGRSVAQFWRNRIGDNR
jgi:hypothetical protein